MFKKIVCLLFICFLGFTTRIFAREVPTIEKFTIYEKPYLMSTYFEMEADDVDPGVIIKSRLAHISFRTHYDFYQSGKHKATGICRLMCLGLFFSWATEIDIYDPSGAPLGVIDGQFMTTAAARFSIYDSAYQHCGIAFLDLDRTGFIIVDPNNETRYIARFQRIFQEDLIDHWECRIYDKEAIDIRILKIFAAFAIDHQEFFREDN